MIIPNSNLIKTVLRRDVQISNNRFTGAAFYITCALLILIVVNLLLTVVLLIQSRRIDEQIKEAIRNLYRRSRSHSQPIAAPIPIPPSRPPRASFPSIHCQDEDRPPSIHFTELSNSQNNSVRSDHTVPNSAHSLNAYYSPQYPTKKGSPAESFNFLVEPISPSSDDPVTAIIP